MVFEEIREQLFQQLIETPFGCWTRRGESRTTARLELG
jgi:hypothetical protein